MSDPSQIFQNANQPAQQKFCDLVGIPMPANPLDQYYNNISNWEKTVPPGSPAYQMAELFKTAVRNLEGVRPPKTSINDLIAAIQSQIFQADPTHDIYMRYPGLTSDQMQSLCNQISNGSTILSSPSITQMDQNYATLTNWLRDKSIKPEDAALYKALLDQIYSRGSSDKGLSDVKSWAQNFTSTDTYLNAGIDAQKNFCQLMGFPVFQSFRAILHESHQLGDGESLHPRDPAICDC